MVMISGVRRHTLTGPVDAVHPLDLVVSFSRVARDIQNIPYLDAGDGESNPREPRRMERLPVAAVVGGMSVALPGVGDGDDGDDEADDPMEPAMEGAMPGGDDLPPEGGGPPIVEADGADEDRRLIAGASDLQHTLSHLPKNRRCDSCMRGK